MYDWIVIGSGIAGLFTALEAANDGSVLVVTKGALEESNTRYAQGGIAAAMAPGDRPALHAQDTLVAGAGLCERAAVDLLAEEAPARIADLLVYQVPFDREGGKLALGREGAHRVARVLHAGGDATGFHIERALCEALRAAAVEVREQTLVTALLLEAGRVVGVRTLDAQGERTILARRVVLASGGAGQLFRHTTNPAVATGDGLALAFRAGAALRDLEFVQFHPTALALRGAPSFLISEAVRGEGGVLRNGSGEPFMERYDPRADLASRDVVARAMVAELVAGRGPVLLDVTHLPAETIQRRFPTILRFCLDHGLDMRREALPVSPAAHYLMGGVATDLWGATSLPNLYACGEVACTGVHGANRLASNSLLEGLVFGKRIVQHARGLAGATPAPSLPVRRLVIHRQEAPVGLTRPGAEALRALLWDAVGLRRAAAPLVAAAHRLARWQASLERPRTRAEHELANMLLVGLLMATAALAREESRGAHARADFPATDERWCCRIELVGGSQDAADRARAKGNACVE
jgi:L-aspartate oxidase